MIQKKVLLSVIIPTLNEEKYLPRLLDSLKRQQLKNFETIVSDGNSEDKTAAIAKQYGCVFLADQKRSPSRQRNNGAEQAKGQIMLFLDADTRLDKNFLSATLNEFLKRKLDVGGFMITGERKLIRRIKSFPYYFFYNMLCRLVSPFTPLAVGAAIMAKKTAHEKVSGFDEDIKLGEDHDYARRISKKGKYGLMKSRKIYFSPRRIKKEGTFKVLIKYTKAAVYYLVKGPIKKEIVEYDFGKYDKNKTKG